MMRWIASSPPIYVWEGDVWYNEKDKKEYTVDLEKAAWVSGTSQFPFTKKTKIFKEKS